MDIFRKIIFVVFILFITDNSFAQKSQNDGLKELVKTQQEKLRSVENSLKQLIGKIENQQTDLSGVEINKLSNKISSFADNLKLLQSRIQTLSEFAYKLEFQIKRLETHYNLSSTVSKNKESLKPSKANVNDKNINVSKEGLSSKTTGVLGYIKDKENLVQQKEKKQKISTKEVLLDDKKNNNPIKTIKNLTPEEQFKIAKSYIAKREYAKAEQAFKEFLEKHKKHDKSADARYWLGRTYYIQKKYSEAALALAEFNNLYPDDKRYEETTLLIAESAVKFAPKEQMCGILTQTREFMLNPSKKFKTRIKKLITKHNCPSE